MTYSLVIVAAILGTWVIFHDNKTIGSSLYRISLLALLFQVIFRYISSYDTEVTLFYIAKDAFVLGILSTLLIISKKNIFAQCGILFASVYFLFNQIPDNKINVNIDDHWEYLVEIKNGEIPEALDKLIKYYNLEISDFQKPTSPELTELDNFIAVGVPDLVEDKLAQIFREIEDIDDVIYIEYNEKLYRNEPDPGNIFSGRPLTSVNDPMTSQQWSLQALNMDSYYDLIRESNLSPQKRAKLYILDTGVNSDHEDLKQVFVKDNNSGSKDNRGHGSHVAGIAAAITDNNRGIASMSPGIGWVQIHGIKVINDFGFGTQKSIIDGIIKAVDGGADVINMSLGGPAQQAREKAYDQAIAYAKSKGTIVVVAAGNSNTDASNFLPAKLKDVITVTAIDSSMKRAHFSNYIGKVSNGVAAPGTDIISTFSDGKYKSFNGTSMASPHVAGIVAVMRSLNPKLNVDEVFTILNKTGVPTKNTKETGKLINPTGIIETMLNQSFVNN